MNAYEKYCAERFTSLKGNLKLYIQKGDEEGLHQFRVELKKINALIHFIEWMEGKKTVKKAQSDITTWLQQAGVLRDEGNFEKLVDEFKLPKSLVNKLEDKGTLRKSSKTLTSHHLHPHTFDKIEAQFIKQAKKLTGADLRNYLKGLINSISSAASRGIVKDQLHEQRKKMKDAMYLLKLYAGKKPDAKTERVIEKLNNCQDVMGQWHDVDKFINRLKGFKHVGLQKKIEPVKEEEKRLMTEVSRFIKAF